MKTAVFQRAMAPPVGQSEGHQTVPKMQIKKNWEHPEQCIAGARPLVASPWLPRHSRSDFRRQTGPIEHWRFFDIIPRGTGSRVLSRVPQYFSGGIQTIKRLVRLTAGVVRSCGYLFAC